MSNAFADVNRYFERAAAILLAVVPVLLVSVASLTP